MNMVTTARTIHLPEEKENNPHDLHAAKEAWSGSIHDLGHIQLRIVWQIV